MPKPAALCLLALAVTLSAAAGDPPEQPLPFSHKIHAGALKLTCKRCHTNPDPGETEGNPPTDTCMQCHSAIKTERPAIQKLAAYFNEKRPIPWVRVYNVLDGVTFSHRGHLRSGNTCEDCHGKVAERDRLAPDSAISMAGCLSCHKAKNADTGCTFCHDPR